MPYLLHGRRHLTLLLVLGHGFPMLQHVLLHVLQCVGGALQLLGDVLDALSDILARLLQLLFDQNGPEELVDLVVGAQKIQLVQDALVLVQLAFEHCSLLHHLQAGFLQVLVRLNLGLHLFVQRCALLVHFGLDTAGVCSE